MVSRESCQASATDIGPATSQVVAELLADRVVDRLHTARRLLGLRERYGDVRLEAACSKALRFADATLRTRQRITSRSVAVRQLPDSAKLAYTERRLDS